MKYNIITDLSSTHFGSYSLDNYDHNSLREIDFKDCLFFETSQVLNKDFSPPHEVSSIKYIYSRKYRPYELFEYPYRCLPFKGKLLGGRIDSITIFSNETIVNSITAGVTNTDSIFSNSGRIDSISATSITAHPGNNVDPGIKSFLGIINNISGDTLQYTKGKFTNISVTGIADLVAQNVKWADLAEIYYGDSDYEPGTLVQFGGTNELTLAKDHVNGCVSKNPGILMNSAFRKYVNSVPLLLIGKTKVKITGPIKKFDKIELSDIPGVARKWTNKSIFGLALESNEQNSTKLVECVLKFTIE